MAMHTQAEGNVDAGKAANPLKTLTKFGQAVWLDYIRRSLLTSGDLQRLIDEDGLRGMTSNPSIFEKAITSSTDYSDFLKSLESKPQLDAKARYELLAIRDIQDAADILRPVYETTKRRDGYVSLEVSPLLARDTKGTIEEARRLWKMVGRQNVMIKVPATPEGTPAVQQLLSEGININITLLFAQEAYEKVAQAYIAALETYAKNGGDLSRMGSVASFFVSRIDTLIDKQLDARLKTATKTEERALLQSLLGKVAIANAKKTYQRYQEIFRGPRWDALAAKGAHTQRLLWASTSTKNPNYRDVMYVEELIGQDTVDTIPPATLDAFRDHGIVRASLVENVEAAHETMRNLAKAGISMTEVTSQLVDDGVKLFADAFEKLLAAVAQTMKAPATPKSAMQTYTLPQALEKPVKQTIDEWTTGGKVRRLWARDATLWTGSDEAKWLGWLGVTEDQIMHANQLTDLSGEVKSQKIAYALLLGMGGSSLCPEVLSKTFGEAQGFPELHVLDSTDPAQIKAIESKIDIKNTLFIVSSKSGSTLEPNIFKQYFFERAKQASGAERAAKQFIAVTDPGSKLQAVAEADGFRHIFFGVPSIGGRYSALSDFGLVPGAAMGIDIKKFLDRTEEMVQACASSVTANENPGAVLGVILGVLAKNGRDKVTLITSPGIRDLGAWLEQLLAESTGKDGKGLIPVDREAIGAPEVYGNDRVFVYVRLESAPDADQDAKMAVLEKAGYPVARISLRDPYDLGQSFFRWEIATAVAGSIIGINAFNQPDVEASKIATKNLTTQYEKTGSLPPEQPIFEENGIKLFTDEKNAAALDQIAGSGKSLASYLRAHLGRLKAGDYFATLAFIEMNDEHEKKLQAIRHAVRDKKRVATCLGFGPRFLHSTGQAYKGGPNTGVFLQITCDDAADIAVPGQKYTFGVVKAAQARGDFAVLAERNRRALRIHLGTDVRAGLAALDAAVRQALA
ncbi:MAG TPA: bifunctional transaldolase/phosoglucose isomerase [Candidatus Limnocylindrales bacterium]|nr:bifunctional transaldolase/phosoglucose isomerase [Candidatus Limnocylindrales bacterium]